MLKVGSQTEIDGEYIVDPKFYENIEAAQENNIKVGVYFYSYSKTPLNWLWDWSFSFFASVCKVQQNALKSPFFARFSQKVARKVAHNLHEEIIIWSHRVLKTSP